MDSTLPFSKDAAIKQLVERLLSAQENGEITFEEMSNLAREIQHEFEIVDSHETYTNSLYFLATQSSVFRRLLKLDSEKATIDKESEIIGRLQQFLQSQ